MSMSMSMSGVERQSGISVLATPMYLITQQVLHLVDSKHNASNDTHVYIKVDKDEKIDTTKKVLSIKKLKMKEFIEQAKELKKDTENILKNVSYEKSDEANELMLIVREIKENCKQIVSTLTGYDAEVSNLIEMVQNGKISFEYDREKHINPLNFMRKFFGKYLKSFGADDDFLYQDQLTKIMGENFVQALRSHIKRHEYFDMNYFVPGKAVRMEKEANKLISQDMTEYNKINSLKTNKRLRNKLS